MRVAGTCAALLVTACGSPGSEPAVDAAPPPDYDDPSDFPREGCATGGFADRAGIAGVYVFRDGYPSYESALRIDDLGADSWSGVYRGLADAQVTVTDDDVLIRQVVPGEGTYVLDLCGRDAGGAWGYQVLCPTTTCVTPRSVTLTPIPTLDEPPSVGMALLGELAWPTANRPWKDVDVEVSGNHAYITLPHGDANEYRAELWIVDVSDPGAPAEAGRATPQSFPVEDWVEVPEWRDAEVIDGPDGSRYAMVYSDNHGVDVVDVTVPGDPDQIASFPEGAGYFRTSAFAIDGTRAYVDGFSLLELWDVTDPASPVQSGTLTLDVEALDDLAALGDRLYASIGTSVHVFDVSDPAAPSMIGAVPGASFEDSAILSIAGRTIGVFDTSSIQLVDLTDGTPGFGTELASWQTRPAVSTGKIDGWADRAAIAYHQDGVRVLDLSNPESPVEIAHCWTVDLATAGGYSPHEGALAVDVDPTTGRVYVLDYERGLLILQLE